MTTVECAGETHFSAEKGVSIRDEETGPVAYRQPSPLSDRSVSTTLWETKNVIIKIQKGDLNGSGDNTIYVGGRRVNSAPTLTGLELLSTGRREGGGRKKQKPRSIFFLTNDILFFSPFVLLPESPSLSHIHFPLLMTPVGQFLQAKPSS